MKVYFYDIKTKRFTGEGKALDNPENPNIPHIPGSATTTKPPEHTEFEAPYYERETNSWKVKPCYIGKKAVNISSKMVETVYYEGKIKEGWQYVTDKAAEEIQSVSHRYKNNNGILIRRTDEDLKKYLFDMEKEKRKSEIKAALETLDFTALRPLRAITVQMSTDEDIQKIKDIETQASNLRIQLKNLE